MPVASVVEPSLEIVEVGEGAIESWSTGASVSLRSIEIKSSETFLERVSSAFWSWMLGKARAPWISANWFGADSEE